MCIKINSNNKESSLLTLDCPSLGIIPSRFLPLFILGQSEEGLGLLTLGYLDNGCDELLQEAGHVQEGWPKVMHEVNHKTLDVTSIVILIGHDHQVTVTQRLDVRLVIRSAKLQTHNLH